jgi:hypothetical protein
MKKFIFKYLAFIGLAGLLFSCQKEDTKVEMLSSIIAPTLKSVPDLTLQRTKGSDTLQFVGTAVNPGFQASAIYYLEADTVGNGFNNPVILYTGSQDSNIKLSVSDINGLLIKSRFSSDASFSIELRLRSVLVQDAGTGVSPYTSISQTKTVNVTTYGLPRLDLINAGIVENISSALGNGIYTGYVKLDATKPFTLKDPDTGTTYGLSGGNLSVNGSTGISISQSGWYKLTVNTNTLSYATDAYMIGLVGSATPNGWNTPDQKMDYNAKGDYWYITLDLIDGQVKFRLNDGWAWNLGGTVDNLTQGGDNINVTAGNYTIKLTIINGTTGKCSIVKN